MHWWLTFYISWPVLSWEITCSSWECVCVYARMCLRYILSLSVLPAASTGQMVGHFCLTHVDRSDFIHCHRGFSTVPVAPSTKQKEKYHSQREKVKLGFSRSRGISNNFTWSSSSSLFSLETHSSPCPS